MEQLCQAYHWSFKDAMRMTIPQIFLLNQSAKFSHDKSKHKSVKQDEVDTKDPIVYKGKRLSKLNSDEMTAYLGKWD